jgi:hypothetical protein
VANFTCVDIRSSGGRPGLVQVHIACIDSAPFALFFLSFSLALAAIACVHSLFRFLICARVCQLEVPPFFFLSFFLGCKWYSLIVGFCFVSLHNSFSFSLAWALHSEFPLSYWLITLLIYTAQLVYCLSHIKYIEK